MECTGVTVPNGRVLFICTHNAGRSQMAEGYLRARYGDRYEAFSAGTLASTVSPLAVRVMAELGIDISGHRSKALGEFVGREMDVVATVCDAAAATCPIFPGAGTTLHASFPDPAAATGTEEERLAVFRSARDRITDWIDATFGDTARDR
jgi:arsenate reductase (thioredoxin)